MNSLKARASILEDNPFWEEARDSSEMAAPSGTRLEFELGVRAEAAGIQIVLIEGGPDASRQSGRGRQASNVGSWGVLLRRASAYSTSGDAQAGEAPVIAGKKRADETAEGVPDVDVCLVGGTVLHE